METLSYVLASPWTRVAAVLGGFILGVLVAAVIARVSER